MMSKFNSHNTMAAGLASDKFKRAVQADLKSKASSAKPVKAGKPVDNTPMTQPKTKASIQSAIDKEQQKVKLLQKKIKQLRAAKKKAPTKASKR